MQKIINQVFSLLLRNGQGDSNDGIAVNGLVALWDGEHADELDFSRKLISGLAETLQGALRPAEEEMGGMLSSPWTIESVRDGKEISMIVPMPHPRIIIRDGERNLEVAMGMIREAHLSLRGATHRTVSKPDHTWAILERSVRPLSLTAVAAASSDSAGKGLEANGDLDTTASARSTIKATTCGESATVTSDMTVELIGGEVKVGAEGGSQVKGNDCSWNVHHILAVMGLKKEGAACVPFQKMRGQEHCWKQH
jgi:hypothetical protein